MHEPVLYCRYEHDEAIALFGPASEVRHLCDGQWVVLPEHVVCFAAVGEPPKMSHFRAAAKFCWTADRPYEFPDDRHGLRTDYPGLNFLPAEVRATCRQQRPIHLFVRQPDEKAFLYVGQLSQSHGWGSGSPGQHFGQGDFDLSPPLASQVWTTLGGLRLDDSGPAALDASLARLNGPMTVLDRLAVLKELAVYWHGAIGPEDGLSEEALTGPLPLPLRWWYQLAGRRPGIVDGINLLHGPEKLAPVEGGRVRFLCENQGCYYWATLPEGEDPPVWGSVDEVGPWIEQGISLSEFLIQACIFEAVQAAVYGAVAAVDAEGLARLSEVVPPLPLTAWHWPVFPTRFHAAGGAFLIAQQLAEGTFGVQVGARTEHPLAWLACVLYGGWEHLDWSPPLIDPAWLAWGSNSAAKLVRAIHQEGRFSDLPILADALADGGCDDEAILGHLRQKERHSRGCYVLDALVDADTARTSTA
jgi:hypothetical protein